MSDGLKRLREAVEAMTGGEWSMDVDRDGQVDIYAENQTNGRADGWIALLPHQSGVPIESANHVPNATGIIALHRSRMALLDLAESVGRLSMYEDHELTSEQFEERINATVDAYRRLLEQLP